VATEAAWLNGKKWKKLRKEQKKLLTGIGLLMEGLETLRFERCKSQRSKRRPMK
jgi:hypothetical protein